MVVVAGMWELSWISPLMELGYWRYPLRDLGVTSLYMAPVTGIHIGDWVIDDLKFVVEERAQLVDIINELRGDATIVFVDEGGDSQLQDFEHPEDVVYVLGRTGFSALTSLKEDGDLAVSIPTAVNRGMLWGHQAASIVLYDRLLKS